MGQRIENVGDLWSDLLKTKAITPVADGAVEQDVVRGKCSGVQ
jgi:hypothetical protein